MNRLFFIFGFLILFAKSVFSQEVINDCSLSISNYTGNSYNVGSMVLEPGFSFDPTNNAYSFESFSVDVNSDPGNFCEFTIYPTSQKNHIIVEEVYVEGVLLESEIDNLSLEDKSTAISYFNASGQSIQDVIVGSSPTKRDIIQVHEFDDFGQSTKAFMPYTANSNGGAYRENGILDQKSFYSNTTDRVVDLEIPYAEDKLDNNNRVVEFANFGEAFKLETGHTVKNEYAINDGSEHIRRWTKSAQDDYISLGYYDAGRLFVFTVIDPHGKRLKLYKDQLGQTICKKVELGNSWIETQYIYDDFGRLVFNIPPEAIIAFENSYEERLEVYNQDPQNNEYPIFDLSDQNILDTWVYSKKHDKYGREIITKIPGLKETHTVYDNRHRIVATQDGEQRKLGQWAFVKYDVWNGVFSNGVYTPLVPKTREELQLELNGIDLESNYKLAFEERTNVIGLHNYTNRSFPTEVSESNFLAIKYFSDYGFDNSLQFSAALSHTSYVDGISGAYVGTKEKVLDGTNNTWLYSKVFYNNDGESIQTVAQNNMGGTTRVTSEYTYTGAILKNRFELIGHEAHVIDNRYEYDHTGRLLNTYHKIDNGSEILVNNLVYNERGQVVETNIHDDGDGNGFLQSIDFNYDERSRLTGINNLDLSGVGQFSDDNNDLFAYELRRSTGLELPGSQPQYNSNIAEQVWVSARDNKLRGFTYSYDDLNRFKEASYYVKESNSWTGSIENHRYDVSNVVYDNNQNIKSLKRNGVFEDDSFGTVDDLAYTYKGNQLIAVNDAISSIAAAVQGFEDNGIQGDLDSPEYIYDDNGRLVEDKNRGIIISYNEIDKPNIISLPNNVQFQFIYDASGRKLSQKIIGNGPDFIREYGAGGVYENGNLKFLAITGGRAVKNQFTNVFRYEYDFKDHLGNTRLTYTKGIDGLPEIIQEDHYYPFGMTLGGLSFANGNDNKFLFQGKESYASFGLNYYDFHNRLFSPVLGRWFAPDALSQYPSPYAYGNPITSIDPDGQFGFLAVIVGAAIINGVINGGQAALRGDSPMQILGHTVSGMVGGAAGAATFIATGGNIIAASAVSGGITSFGSALVGGGSFEDALIAGGVGAIAGGVGGAIAGPLFGKLSGPLTSKLGSNVLGNGLAGIISGAAAGFGGGFTSGFLMGENPFKTGLQGAKWGAALGGVLSAGGTAVSNYKAGNNVFTGKSKIVPQAQSIDNNQFQAPASKEKQYITIDESKTCNAPLSKESSNWWQEDGATGSNLTKPYDMGKVDPLHLTTSSKSTAPSRTYAIYNAKGQLHKFGVTDANLNRYNQSLLEAGPGATGRYSSPMPKYQAHINEKYLRSVQYNSTGQYTLPGMKIPYPVDFNTGFRIRPSFQ